MVDVATKDDLDKMQKQLDAVGSQFMATGGKAHNYGVQMDIVKRAQQNLVNIWQGSVIGKAQLVGRWFKKLSKVVTEYSNDADDMADATADLTIIQRNLIAPLLKGTGAAKLGQAMWNKYRHTIVKNDGSIKLLRAAFLMLSSVLLTIVGILGIIGFAFVVFSLATEGAASPIIAFVEEHIPQLKEAFEGIINLLQGDFTASWKNIQGFLLLVAAAFLLLPGALAPLIIGIMIGVAAFKKFEESGDSWQMALGKAVTLAAGAMWVILSFLTPAKIGRFLLRAIRHVVKFIGVGGVLVLAGLAGLWLAASGKLSARLSVVVALISAAAIWLGLALVSSAIGTSTAIGAAFAMIPFFWVAAFFLILALGYRFRSQIWALFMDIGEGIINIFIFVINTVIDIIMIPFNIIIGLLAWATGSDTSILGAGDTIAYRAAGGPVRAGRSYIVGERGPELFTAGSSGNITPNNQMGGANNTITMNIDVSGVTDRSDKRALAREISDMLSQEMRRLGGAPTRGRY